MPDQRVVAPPKNQQRWSGFAPYQGATFGGDSGAMGGMMDEGTGLSSEVLPAKTKQTIELYTQLSDTDREAFMAFILGGDEAEK